jgi:hypothetical protein
MNNIDMEKVIYKRFGNERTTYFNMPDIIQNEHYLTYRKHKEAIILTIGSNDGEVDIGLFWVAEELEKAIERMLYNCLGR